jgi:hypothetical protein
MGISYADIGISSADFSISSATIGVSTGSFIVSSASMGISYADIGISSADIAITNATISNVTLDTNLLVQDANPDAFGRQRVSQPYTLFEFNSILGKNPYYINEQVTGTGANSAAQLGDSFVKMTVKNNGDSVIRQSREYILYQPGKSKLIYMTGVLGMTISIPGVVSRIGCYDASMGVYIENAGGTLNIVEHLDGTYNIVPRSAWDSSINFVDFTKAQIYTFDMEWLGVGQVRCGIL